MRKKKFAIGGGQEDDKFDALGNKIVVEKVAEELDRGAIKQLQKTLKILKESIGRRGYWFRRFLYLR